MKLSVTNSYPAAPMVWEHLLNWLAVPTAKPSGRLYLAIFGLWLLGLTSLPIVYFLGGEPALIWAISFNVITQVTLVLAILRQAWGPRRALLTGLAVVILTWLIEWLGATTGLPFGAYSYTDKLQPQLGLVPWAIPLAWLMMLPPAWALAYQAVGLRSRLLFAGMSALALTAWDLFLDPQMVQWGFWRWEEVGDYFGIPWSNFGGWLLASGIITLLVRPAPLPARPLLLIYGVIWLLQTLGQLFFWGLPGPALAGFIGMGSCLLLAAVAPGSVK